MPSKTNGIGVQVEDTRICVVMVGLPARGKSYIAQKGESFHFPHLFQSSVLRSLEHALTVFAYSATVPQVAFYPSCDI